MTFKSIKELEAIKRNPILRDAISYDAGRLTALKDVLKLIKNLNINFRKDNTPQRLSGDEFNDLWEEELKARITGEELENQEEK